MENVAEQDLAVTDQAWKAIREEATNCHEFDLSALVDRAIAHWKAGAIGYRAMAYAQLDRPKCAALARSLREAEQALFAVVTAAFPLYRAGHGIRMDELMFSLARCRFYIVLPVARRMAEQDETGRLPEVIAQLIASKAQFIDGRAVIDQTLASELPSPHKGEPAMA